MTTVREGGWKLLVVATTLFLGVMCSATLVQQARRHQPAREPVSFSPPTNHAGQQTNVVVVIGCTVRADQLTPYGAPTNVTPFLESMAQRGTRFESALANAPWTRPAVTALLTSRHALTVGVTEPDLGLNNRALPDDVTTLAEHMKRSGRATYGWTGNPNASAMFNFDQGFDEFALGEARWTKGDLLKPEGSTLVAKALTQLTAHSANSKQPFYLQLLLVDAHMPDPAGWWEQSVHESVGINRRTAKYRARLRRLDEAISELNTGLEALGFNEENTVFVFVGDHGEGLHNPRHHGKAHGNYLYPSAVHIPWIVKGPGIAQGHVVSGLAQQLDLLPTLLDHLALPPEPEATGASRKTQLQGGQNTSLDRVFVDTWFRQSNRAAAYTPQHFCQHDFDPQASAAWQAQRRAEGRKVPQFKSECFQWRDDPGAFVTMQIPTLHAEIQQWRHDKKTALTPSRTTIDSETARELRALGYLTPAGP